MMEITVKIRELQCNKDKNNQEQKGKKRRKQESGKNIRNTIENKSMDR